MPKQLYASDWSEIEQAVTASEIPTFRTKADAIKAGREFRFPHALQIHRRFERVWICANSDLEPDQEGDLIFDVLRVPLLRWMDDSGVRQGAIVKFRRLRPTSGNYANRTLALQGA